MLRTSRPIVACVLALFFAATACTSEATPTTTELTIPVNTTETTAAPEVEEPAPIVVDRKQSLALSPGECYAALTIEQPRNAAAPESDWFDVVDCNGTHVGAVYAVGCLGVAPESEELVVVACPGVLEDVWPGKVELQRSAVKACLGQFEAVFDESYAETERRSRELVPTEETWLVGERRVVCSVLS